MTLKDFILETGVVAAGVFIGLYLFLWYQVLFLGVSYGG